MEKLMLEGIQSRREKQEKWNLFDGQELYDKGSDNLRNFLIHELCTCRVRFKLQEELREIVRL